MRFEEDFRKINILVSTFYQLIKHETNLNAILKILSAQLLDYEFRRVNQTFIYQRYRTKIRDKKISRVINGYAVGIKVLYRFFEENKNLPLQLAYVCNSCGELFETDYTIEDVKLPSLEGTGLLLTIESKNFVFDLTKYKRAPTYSNFLGNDELFLLLLSKSTVIISYYRKDDSDVHNLFRFKNLGETKTVDQNVSGVGATNVNRQEKTIINQKKVVKPSIFEEIEAKQQILKEKLSIQLRNGKYAGESFYSLIGSKPRYIIQLLEEEDPTEELSDYISDVIKLGVEINFDGFPELLELRSLLREHGLSGN